MKKVGFTLVIGLFLLAFAYAFAQEEEAAEAVPVVTPVEEVTAPDRGLVKGKVTDTQTPRPNYLADATVTVASDMLLGDEARSVTTDLAGNYQVSNLPPGEYVVTVSKPGYDDSQDYVTVTPGGAAFHDVRLYKTDILVSLFRKTRVVRGILLVCLVVMIIYIISRRSSSQSQKE